MAFRLSVQTTLPVPFVSVSTANLEPVEMSSTTTFAKSAENSSLLYDNSACH
jgi:hypothetical protein